MYVSTNRFWLRISVSMRSLLWLSLGMALVMSSRMAVGQEGQPPAQTQFGDAAEDGWLFGDQLSGQSGEAFGALLRAGVQTGPAIGRDTSIVPIELMPYAFVGKGMLFGDIRGFRATKDQWGANFGGGFRYHSERFDRIFGANAYYDYDNTSGVLFSQMGFGLETLGELWDMRANVYLPTGVTEQLISTNFIAGSERFVDHRILFDQRRIIGSALTGVDLEVVTPLPGRLLQRHDVRVAAGAYHYQGQELDGFTGWKTRLQGNVLPSIQLQLEVTNDKIFATNVVFGAAWTYGGYRQPESERRTQFNRMTEPVRRNYNVIVSKTAIIDADQVAFNPNTGDPYFVEHVASSAGPGGNGEVLTPWQTVPQAQADLAIEQGLGNAGPGDIIFVHADSVYDGINFPGANSVTLTPSIRILGEGDGVVHRINVANLGQIPLPRATLGVARPIFQDAAGDGVTLVSGSAAAPSEFSGFQIINPADNGIFGDMVSNVKITQTDVNFADGDGDGVGDGVLLTDLTGPVTFLGVLVNHDNPTGSAFHVSGGTGGVTFGDELISGAQAQIISTGGRSLLIENTLLNSFVDLTGSTIVDTAGQGILIDNSVSLLGGRVTVDTTTINQGTTTGVEIIGGSGIVNFIGPLTINQSTDDAIDIHDTLTGSSIAFGSAGAAASPVTITDRNARGINLRNNAGQVSFRGAVSVTDAVAPFALPAAIEYQSSSGNVRFETVTLNGGLGDGILIGEAGTDNSGQFLVSEQASISNFAGNGVVVTDDDSTVQFNGLNIFNRGLSGININNSRGTVTFNGLTFIDNLAAIASTSPAVDIQDNAATANVVFDTLTITGATRPLGNVGGAGLNVINNLPSVTVNSLNVTSIDGIGLFVLNAGDSTTTPTTPTGGVFTTTGVIVTTGDRPAIEVRDSVIRLGFEAVSSANSLSEGIVLTDNVGTSGGDLFTITGINGALTTGGLITGAGADGALFRDTGGVSLSGMTIQGSGDDGIDASATTLANALTSRLELVNSSITGNAGFGVQTRNIPIVTMLGNTIQNNGLSEIRLIAATNSVLPATPLLYTYVIGNVGLGSGNSIMDLSPGLFIDDAVVISTQGAGIGSNLDLTFVNNTVSTTGIFDTGLQVNWDGPVTGILGGNGIGADVNLNVFSTVGPPNGVLSIPPPTAVRFTLPSATAASSVNILSNTFTSTGDGNIGIDVITGGGGSNIVVGRLAGQLLGNQMQFTGDSDRAIQMLLGLNSTATITDNTIVMSGNLSEAIRFQQVRANSVLAIQRNNITIDDGPFGNNFNERGINIVSVNGGANSIFLNGGINTDGINNNDNNIIIMNGVTGSGTPFFVAPVTNTLFGTIFVNGVPQP